MDHSPPGSSVLGICQARVLECVAMPSSQVLPNPGLEPRSLISLALAGGLFGTSTPGRPNRFYRYSWLLHGLLAKIQYGIYSYSILKSRDIALQTKVHLVKAMVFPVVMYGCESWTIKKAEHWRIDTFELSCWRRLLRVPWTARISNQSILKEISPGVHWKNWCGSWNSNTLATWCKELIHWKRPWRWERLKAGGEGDDRGWDSWMASPTRCTWVWASFKYWW